MIEEIIYKKIEKNIPKEIKGLFYHSDMESFFNYACTIKIGEGKYSLEGPDKEVIKLIDNTVKEYDGSLPIQTGGIGTYEGDEVLWSGERYISVDNPDFRFAVSELLINTSYWILHPHRLKKVNSTEEAERLIKEAQN